MSKFLRRLRFCGGQVPLHPSQGFPAKQHRDFPKKPLNLPWHHNKPANQAPC